MGGNMFSKATPYCQISGCTPEITRAQEWWRQVGNGLGPLTRQALASLLDEDEKAGQNDIKVIACLTSDGRTVSERPEFVSPQQIGPHSDFEFELQVVPCRIEGDEQEELWHFGMVTPISKNPTLDFGYQVLVGAHILVQTSALHILDLSTHGGVTPERFWRVAMSLGKGEQEKISTPGLDYGKEIDDAWAMGPSVVPGMTAEEVVSLEELDSVDCIKSAIAHKGHFWIWMRPDRFPLEPEANERTEPSLIEPPSLDGPTSHIEDLPVEVLTIIAANLNSLSSLQSFVILSRQIRWKLLGTEADRNTLARAWIYTSAPWYIPYTVTPGQSAGGKVAFDKSDSVREALNMGYLRRCLESGSMRNRKRIWGVARQIEQKYFESGLES